VVVHDIVEDYKVWVAVPSSVVVVVAAAVEIVWVLALVTMVLSLVEPVVGRFHWQVDHMDRMDPGLDIYVVFLVAAVRLAEAKAVIAKVN
jgi:hypothetical protein